MNVCGNKRHSYKIYVHILFVIEKVGIQILIIGKKNMRKGSK